MRAPRLSPALVAVLAFVLFTAIFGALAVARPHVAERWALYLGSPEDPAHARLFLDPFPSQATCETRVKAFAGNLERSFCAARRELQFGDGNDAILAADFDPLRPDTWFCPRPIKRARTALLADGVDLRRAGLSAR